MKKCFFLLALMLIGSMAVAQSVDATPVEETIYSVVETDPEYPGGIDALYKYLVTNAHYPENARQHGIQGTVYITFIIERDGSISNVKVLRSPSDELSAEAVRLVKAMARWKPGKQNGKPVRVQFNLPINFSLD